MAANIVERLVISDFRPGIYSDYHAAGAATPADTTEGAVVFAPGVAVIDDTYRCCADRSGALMPLPALVTGKQSGEANGVLPGAAGNYLTGMAAAYLLDASILTEMFVETEQTANDVDRAAVFTMYGQWYLTDAYRWTVVATMHRLFQAAAASQDIMYSKGDATLLAGQAAQAHLGGGNFTPFRARDDINSNFTTQAMAWVAYGSPGYSANPPGWATGAIPAGELAITDFDEANGSNYPDYDSSRLLGLFPDYDNLTTAQSKFLTIAGFTAVTYLITHQGRLIGASRDHGAFGETVASDVLGNLTEHIHYTPPFDFDASLGIGALEFGTFGETRPYLSGVVASITANDLLLIKDHAGGVLVRGDLDNPTVVQLPFIHSTRGARSIPAATPDGLIYGTRNGVYAWQGGEVSQHISPQLDGFFWDHDDESREHLGSRGRFAYWEPWVTVPNNWLFDTRHGSWWRLDQILNGAAFNCYDVAPSSTRLYAFPWKVDATNDVLWYTATPDTLAETYRWKSQPLAQTRDRIVAIRDLRILASNPDATASQVTITLHGYGPDGAVVQSPATVFNLAANTRPQQIETLVAPNFNANLVQVEIFADGQGSPAPKIHSVSIGLGSRYRIPNT